MSKPLKTLILKWYLRVFALIQFCLWGLTHTFFPKWYAIEIAKKDPSIITNDTILMINEIGIAVLALSIATWIAASKPVKHFPVILMIYINGIGSIIATLYHILIRQASSEWSHVFTLFFLLLIMTILYPWKELRNEKSA